MIKRWICFLTIIFLLIILLCREIAGMQWKPELHPGIKQNQGKQLVTIVGQVYQKKQQSEKQILYISNKKSKTIIYSKQNQKIYMGDIITATGFWSAFDKPRNPGNFNQEFYYHKEGISSAVFAETVVVTDSTSRSILHIIGEQLYQFKLSWESIFIKSLGKDKGAIMTGIILGDKSQMDMELKEVYQTNGIGHILAISGLHISFIGLYIYQLLRKLGLNFKGAGSISMILLFLYAGMVGAGISSVRAVIMLCTRIMADILGRVYDVKTALAAAALVLVIWKPLYLFDAGFLFSFGALIGIVYVHPMLKNACLVKGRLWEGISVSISVNLVLFPILLYFYFEFPVYSILLNILVIPLMSWILGAGIVGSGMYLLVNWLGKKVLQSCGVILWIYEKSCEIIRFLPFSRIVFGKPKVWQILVYYLVLIVLLMIFKHKEMKKSNAVFLVFAAVLMGVICAQGHGKNGSVDVTMLDVGQGDSIFIRGPTGTTYLVDGGSTDVKEVGKYRIEPYLKSEGVGSIDYIFLSHGDADHINGIEELINRQKVGVKIKSIVLPVLKAPDEALLNIAKLAAENGINVLGITKGEQLIEKGKDSEMIITSLHPGAQFIVESKNASSLVLSLEAGDFRMLLTGDVEAAGEQELAAGMEIEQYDILKVAHHGSENSTISEFLEKAKPRIALISAGRDNRYGHPHEETIQKLEAAGCRIYSTQKKGAVQFSILGH